MQQPLANILETMSHLSPEEVMPVKVSWYLEVFFCTHGTGRQELKTIAYCLYIKMSLRNQFWKL